MGENNLNDIIPENGVDLTILSKIKEYKIPLLGTSGIKDGFREWYPIGSIVSSNQKHIILASPHTAVRTEERSVTNEEIFKIIQQAFPILLQTPEEKLDGGLKFRDAETCAECVISLKNNLTRREKQNGNIFHELDGYQLPQIRLKTVSIFNENYFKADVTLNEDKACKEYCYTYEVALWLNEFEKETGSIKSKGDKKKASKFVDLNFDENNEPNSYQAWLALHDSEYPGIKQEVDARLQHKINQEVDAAWDDIKRETTDTSNDDIDDDLFDEEDTVIPIPQETARRKRKTKKYKNDKNKNESVSFLNKQEFLYIINEVTKRIISQC